MDAIEQKAEVSSFSGTAQVIRGGFFLPLEPGMQLQAGDRISTEADSTVVIKFTGVNQPLVIQNGSAATLYQDTTTQADAPQWMVSDLYGEQVYFAEKDSEFSQSSGADSFHGLFYTGEDAAPFPLLETAAAVAVGALVISEYDSNDNDTTTSTVATSSSDASSQQSADASATPSDPDPSTSMSPDLGPLAAIPGSDQVAGGLGMVESGLNDNLLAGTPLQSPISTITSSLADGGSAPIPTDPSGLPL